MRRLIEFYFFYCCQNFEMTHFNRIFLMAVVTNVKILKTVAMFQFELLKILKK